MSNAIRLLIALTFVPLSSGASELTPAAGAAPDQRPTPARPSAPSSSAVESEVQPAAGGSLRAVPLRIPFQGFLRDAGDLPVNGSVSLDLTLYDSAVGGLIQWGTESHPVVTVDEGIFQVSLGTSVPLPTSIFDGSPLWLGVSVDGEAELPRTELQSTPFAMRASVADVAIADDGDWEFAGVGPNVRYPGDVIMGGDAGSADLDSEVLIIQAETQDWSVGVLNESTTADSDFLIDTSNAGLDNKFRIKTSGDVGIGTADPEARLHVAGSLKATGVIDLPDGSITADMTAGEPGVAYDRGNPALTLTNVGMQDIHVVSITAPGPGYILVQAQTYSRHNGTTGANSARFQIDETQGGGALAFHPVTVGPEASPSTASTRFPISLSRVFTIGSAGTYTYRLEGEALNPSPAAVACFNGGISAMYIPTPYGAVDTGPANPGPVDIVAP